MKQIHFILSAIMLVMLSACQHYYLARNVKPDNASAQLNLLKNDGRYFVFHGNGKPVYMKNLSLSSDQNILRFEADTLSMQHKLHLTKGRGGKFRYQKNNMLDSAVIREVHVYAPSTPTIFGQELIVPLNQVQKIEVLEIDKPRTRNSQTLGAVGYSVGAAAIILGVAGAIAMSNWNLGSN